MTDMTPCEERGLKEGQWVWAHDANYGEAAWVEFRRIRAEGVFICFYPPLRKELNFLKDEIDFTKGIHDEKPSWTPKEYGGEGPLDAKEIEFNDMPPVKIQRGDHIFREDIPDEATFNAIVAECGRQGFRNYHGSKGWEWRRSKLRGEDFEVLYVDGDDDVVWGWHENTSGRRLTPSDLGINTEKAEQVGAFRNPMAGDQTIKPDLTPELSVDDPREPDWEKAPEGATHYLPEDNANAPAWLRRTGRGWEAIIQGESVWDSYFPSEGEEELMIPRPTTPWSGHEDGLPPVGWHGECRNYLYLKTLPFHRGTVVYHGKKGPQTLAVVEFDSGDIGVCSAPGDFRPLQSERERAIEGAEKALSKEMGIWAGSHEVGEALEHLYDAGWLKEPERV